MSLTTTISWWLAITLRESLVTAGAVTGICIVASIASRIAQRKLAGTLGTLIGQLTPVVILAAVVVGLLIILDPDQASNLLDATIRYVPRALMAVLVIIITRTLGQIVGLFAETALRRISPTVATRVRLAASYLLLGIGVIIALDQLGVSTTIIYILVGGLTLSAALAGGLAAGLGSLPVSRQVAAGRYVKERFHTGQLLRVGTVEGRLISMGISSSRLEVDNGTSVEIPNEVFLAGPVSILPD